jgi:hypothetical protein
VQQIRFQALALDLAGKPQAGVALDVKAVARITTTSRKRMVGGFYTYDNKTDTKDLGTVCSGTSDARGLLLCDTSSWRTRRGGTGRDREATPRATRNARPPSRCG